MERNAVTERFLKYSLERNCKICVVLMQAGQMKKVNLRVTAKARPVAQMALSVCVISSKRAFQSFFTAAPPYSAASQALFAA